MTKSRLIQPTTFQIEDEAVQRHGIIKEIAESLKLTIAEMLDRLLLVLWDSLFLDQAESWADQEVSNLPADETQQLAFWFMKGVGVGSKSIFDGICNMCGCLLHGSIDQRSGLSNKTAGPPLSRDGAPAAACV